MHREEMATMISKNEAQRHLKLVRTHKFDSDMLASDMMTLEDLLVELIDKAYPVDPPPEADVRCGLKVFNVMVDRTSTRTHTFNLLARDAEHAEELAYGFAPGVSYTQHSENGVEYEVVNTEQVGVD